MKIKRAFTLIELLVVIAIIAILAAILFPVFAQAKSAAKKTQSLSNIKQVALGTLMYIGDNDDMFPAGSNACWWQPIDGGWTYSILPYIKSVPILISPGDPKSKATWPAWMRTIAEAVNISYISNGYMRDPGGQWGMYGVMGMDQQHDQKRADGSCTATGWMAKGLMNAGEVTRPSETIMFAESYNFYPVFGPSNFVTGVNWWDGISGTGGWIPDSRRNGSPYLVNSVVFTKDNKNGAINTDWAGKTTFSWVDGHTSALSPQATNPVPTDPDKNMWDSIRS